MDGSDPLSGLRDVHLPPAPEGISAWPIVAGAVALLIFILWLVTRPRRRWARDISRSLETIDSTMSDAALTEAARVLRQAALLKLGPEAKRLNGDAWLVALDRLFRTRFFSSGTGQVFGERLYCPELATISAKPVLTELRRLARRQGRWPW
jgi:hypothetical protein